MKFLSNPPACPLGRRAGQRGHCVFCTSNVKVLDYKDAETLKCFLNPQAKILPKRRTGLCAGHQRELARCIKRARVAGLLPYLSR